MTRYKLQRVRTEWMESRPAVWSFAKKPVRGIEHKYDVLDDNLARRNHWKFVVRVPRKKSGRIEVRPLEVPNLKAWADLTRRALTFSRATKPGYTDKRYCFVALSDVTGEQTKRTAGRGQRLELPAWFGQLRHRMRLKRTVRPTRGTDGQKQVVLVKSSDHVRMIQLFFATKVWTLKEQRGLPPKG